MFYFRDLFCEDVGIDLGTVNTVVALKGSGIVLREPSVVAKAAGSANKIKAIGSAALDMLGRAPGTVTVVQPIKDGVVADFALTAAMLKHVIAKTVGRQLPGGLVRAVVCVPGCMSDIERRALESALHGAGAREAFLMDESMAAAIGAGIDVDGAKGSMIVDIGGGTIDSAVLAFGGVVMARSHRAGGTHVDKAIVDYMRANRGLIIGQSTAENVKLTLCACMPGQMLEMTVCGRDVENGLPREVRLTSTEVYSCTKRQIQTIVNVILQTLEGTPPEISGDLLSRGITLTGGGAMLNGLRELVEMKTCLPTRIADEPLDCVARGALFVAENIRHYRQGKARRAG